MTAAEKLFELSELTVCATAEQHFCSITEGGTTLVFIPTDELEGVLTVQDELKGSLEDVEELNGELIENIELKGSIEDQELTGGNEDNNELKGDTECQ